MCDQAQSDQNLAGRISDCQECKLFTRGQRRLRSDCADAQADLSRRLAHMSVKTHFLTVHLFYLMRHFDQVLPLNLMFKLEDSLVSSKGITFYLLTVVKDKVPYFTQTIRITPYHSCHKNLNNSILLPIDSPKTFIDECQAV